MDFEKKLQKLEEIVANMEKGDLSLENSLKSFEEGVTLSRQCNEQLNEAEQKVKILIDVDKQGNAKTDDFKADS